MRTHVNGQLDGQTLITHKNQVAQKREMVQVWFMDDDEVSDQRLEHKRSPPAYMELKELYNKTGVEYFQVIRP